MEEEIKFKSEGIGRLYNSLVDFRGRVDDISIDVNEAIKNFKFKNFDQTLFKEIAGFVVIKLILLCLLPVKPFKCVFYFDYFS